DLAGELAPAQHPIVGDVGEQQVAAVAEPDRALEPTAAGPQPLNDALHDGERAEPVVEHLDRGIRQPDDSPVDVPGCGGSLVGCHLTPFHRPPSTRPDRTGPGSPRIRPAGFPPEYEQPLPEPAPAP